MKTIYLVNYPRTGSSWLHYCIQYLFMTNQTTITNNHIQQLVDNGAQLRNIPPFVNEYKLDKNHTLNSKRDNPDTIFVCIVRNYIECIIRHEGNITVGGINGYSTLIDQFVNWKNKKALVYYEDLMTKPFETLEKLIIDVDGKYLPSLERFKEDYELLRELSLQGYQKAGATPITRGESLTHHGKHLTNEQIQHYNTLLKQRLKDPNKIKIVDRYLA